ncbi:hypothetical protein V8C34DRAFT_294562 [Trichoderma compactum]
MPTARAGSGRARKKPRSRPSNQHRHRQAGQASKPRNAPLSPLSPSPASRGVGLGLTKTQSTPSVIPQRPPLRPRYQTSSRASSANFHTPTPPSRSTESSSRSSNTSTIKAVQQTSPGLPNRTPSTTSLSGYTLRSRGSGSKLPLPVTPGSRTGTPNLNQEQSLTDSSMASSIFSRKSVDTVPTPAHNSPAVSRILEPDDKPDVHWGALPTQRERRQRRCSTPPPPPSPGLSLSSSVMSSPTALRAEILYGDDGDPNVTVRPRKIATLQPMKSLAKVAKKEIKQLRRLQ